MYPCTLHPAGKCYNGHTPQEEGGLPRTWSLPQTKVTIVVKSEIYKGKGKILLGHFGTQKFGSQTPSHPF